MHLLSAIVLERQNSREVRKQRYGRYGNSTTQDSIELSTPGS